MSCFRITSLILQTINYRAYEKYVECHDGIDKSFLRLTLVFDLCKTKHIYLVRDNRIMTLNSNQTLTWVMNIYVTSEGRILTTVMTYSRFHNNWLKHFSKYFLKIFYTCQLTFQHIVTDHKCQNQHIIVFNLSMINLFWISAIHSNGKIFQLL